METKNGRPDSGREKMLEIYKSFMARVTKYDEAVAVGSRFLLSFQQSLEFLRRPPLDRNSKLIENIIKVNETERFRSYFEAGCLNASSGAQSLANFKTILIELEGLLEDVIRVLEAANVYLLPAMDEGIDTRVAGQADVANQEEAASLNAERPELTDYATMMGVLYSMSKQDCIMQEKIVNALNLKLSAGELETYCTMWSLRPFIDDELMHQAWQLIP